MAHLLNIDAENLPQGRIGARRFFVRNLPFDNAAAKFWTTLFDEICEYYPACDTVVMEADTGGLLSPVHLNPELALQAGMETLKDADMKRLFDEIASALEIIGPPCPIHITLQSGATTLETKPLPLECVDAEITPFLLAWILEWASLVEYAWNNDRIAGKFKADDRDRGFEYQVAFDLHNRHLSEGLYRRRLTIRFVRQVLVPT